MFFHHYKTFHSTTIFMSTTNPQQTLLCTCSQPAPTPAPARVPRPRNAFILYRQHHHAKVVASNPGKTNPEISKIIGERWRSLSAKEKDVWIQLGDEEKKSHLERFPDYRYQPRRSSKKSLQPMTGSICPVCKGLIAAKKPPTMSQRQSIPAGALTTFSSIVENDATSNLLRHQSAPNLTSSPLPSLPPLQSLNYPQSSASQFFPNALASPLSVFTSNGQPTEYRKHMSIAIDPKPSFSGPSSTSTNNTNNSIPTILNAEPNPPPPPLPPPQQQQQQQHHHHQPGHTPPTNSSTKLRPIFNSSSANPSIKSLVSDDETWYKRRRTSSYHDPLMAPVPSGSFFSSCLTGVSRSERYKSAFSLAGAHRSILNSTDLSSINETSSRQTSTASTLTNPSVDHQFLPSLKDPKPRYFSKYGYFSSSSLGSFNFPSYSSLVSFANFNGFNSAQGSKPLAQELLSFNFRERVEILLEICNNSFTVDKINTSTNPTLPAHPTTKSLKIIAIEGCDHQQAASIAAALADRLNTTKAFGPSVDVVDVDPLLTQLCADCTNTTSADYAQYQIPAWTNNSSTARLLSAAALEQCIHDRIAQISAACHAVPKPDDLKPMQIAAITNSHASEFEDEAKDSSPRSLLGSRNDVSFFPSSSGCLIFPGYLLKAANNMSKDLETEQRPAPSAAMSIASLTTADTVDTAAATAAEESESHTPAARPPIPDPDTPSAFDKKIEYRSEWIARAHLLQGIPVPDIVIYIRDCGNVADNVDDALGDGQEAAVAGIGPEVRIPSVADRDQRPQSDGSAAGSRTSSVLSSRSGRKSGDSVGSDASSGSLGGLLNPADEKEGFMFYQRKMVVIDRRRVLQKIEASHGLYEDQIVDDVLTLLF